MNAQQNIQSEIDRLVRAHGKSRDALMPILQDLNRAYSYVSDEAMKLVAKELGLPKSEVYGVVTFYSFLSPKPRGKYIVRLCQTISCEMAGSYHPVVARLLKELKIGFGETTPDGMFTLERTNCIGMCDEGPAMLVNEDVHTRLTEESFPPF